MVYIRHVYGTMVTMTTYGMWLRGDARGWADDGRIFPANPGLENHDKALLKFPPFTFEFHDLLDIGEAIGNSLITRLKQKILALAVQLWHVHFIVSESDIHISKIVKCAKEAVRYHLRVKRPIWTADYDKRFCFDQVTMTNRINYVERHNVELGWNAKPWSFITKYED
jgi:hypothetical protein